jgi:hypothetical protein
LGQFIFIKELNELDIKHHSFVSLLTQDDKRKLVTPKKEDQPYKASLLFLYKGGD